MSTQSTLTLLTPSEVPAAIVLLASDAASVQARIHLIACSTLDHVRQYGDYRGAVQLMNALPNGQRVKALGHWYRVYSSGKLAFKLDKATKVWDATLAKTREDEDFKIGEAVETTFADLTTERDPVSVTVDSMIRNLTRTATNTDMHDGTDIAKVSPEAREFASKLVAFATEAGYRKAS